MKRGMAAVLLAVSVMLGSGQTQAQPVSVDVYTVLGRLSEALPAPGGSLQATVVYSTRYAVRVSGERVTVTTAFLREASSNALAAGVTSQLLPDPIYFAITMERAGFDGPSGLAELNERLLYDVAIENQYRAAVNAAYADMMRAILDDSFWMFALPAYELMYGPLDAATNRYYEALAAYEAYRAQRPELPTITAEFIRSVTEVTTTLRSGSAGVSPWHPRIQETLKAYPPRREE